MHIEARIVKILSKFVVVLNAGSQQGVIVGTEFEIYEKGEEILDPETKESLGQLEIIKGSVTVSSVQTKLSVAEAASRTEKRQEVIDPIGGLSAVMSALGPRTVTRTVRITDSIRIECEQDDYSPRLVVRVGDHARADVNEPIAF